MVDRLAALRKLKAAGTRVIFEEENMDTDNIKNELLISVMESFAQTKNETRSDNIRMGLSAFEPLMEPPDYTNGSYMVIPKMTTET